MGHAGHPLQRIEIETCLGPVSDDLAHRIVASGATLDELAIAIHDFGLGRQPQGGGRVDELCQLLSEELGPEHWPDY